MALTDENVPPGLVEQYAVAVNTSDLDHRALDIVGAMGFARLELAAAANTDAAVVAADLGSLIWRGREGKDRAAQGLMVHAFAEWMRVSMPWAEEVDRADPGLVERFASRVIDEWLNLRCSECCGGGRMQRLPNGKLVKPGVAGRGYAKLANCERCSGTGRRKVSHPERKRVLGGVDRVTRKAVRRVDAEEYENLWQRHFARAFGWLRELANEPRERLHDAAKGAKVRP